MAFERSVAEGIFQLFHRLVRFVTNTADTTWKPNTYFPRGTIIKPDSHYKFVCIQEGRSGTQPPPWSAITKRESICYMNTLPDNTCLWQVCSYSNVTLQPVPDYIVRQSNITSYLILETDSTTNAYTPNPTIEFKILLLRNSPSIIPIFGWRSPSTWWYGVAINTNNQIVFGKPGGFASEQVIFSPSLNLNSLYTIKIEYTPPQIKLYINDSLVETKNFNYQIPTSVTGYLELTPLATYTIEYVKLYDGQNLIGYWQLVSDLYSDNFLFYQVFKEETILNILQNNKESYLQRYQLVKNLVSNWGHFYFNLLNFSRHLMWFKFVRSDDLEYFYISFEINSEEENRYNINFSITHSFPYNQAIPEYYYASLLTWSPYTPISYIIQSDKNYLTAGINIGLRTYAISLGEFISYYSYQDFSWPLYVYTWNIVNKSFTDTNSIRIFGLNSSGTQWVNYTDWTTYQRDYIPWPFNQRYFPLFKMICGANTIFGELPNIYHIILPYAYPFTFIYDTQSNLYCVIPFSHSRGPHLAIKIE